MASPEIHQLSQEIADLLAKSLAPDRNVRRAAEEALTKLETSSKLYGLAALYLTRRDDLGAEVYTSAAIAFKNFIKRNWHYDPNDETSDQVDKIDPSQRELIKQHITRFMIESPALIQRQLSEAITIIGQSDFPEKWPSLIVELKTSLSDDQNQNFNCMQGILQTAHSIFRRYRHEMRSDQLWTEIKFVIDNFAQPFTDRFKCLVLATKSASKDQLILAPIYQSLLLCTKIYHSLITQDLPEYFEDRLNEWLPPFLELLNTQDVVAEPPMVVEDMKSEICEIASLFVQRYSDAENFKDYTQQFVSSIWNLLGSASKDTEYDTLVSTAIRFLVTVAERPEYRPLFQDANILSQICQHVIIPNLMLRDIDKENFEDDPEEYVKRDIEGSDVDTRRRAACDLVRALSKFLEEQLAGIFGGYIEEMLKSYEANPAANWKDKDLAIFLYSAMAIKGSTRQHGTVTISSLVNVEQFFEQKIVSSLNTDSNQTSSLILQADALRYLTNFRNHISLNVIMARLPLVVELIKSNNVVVRTYAAITLEKLLTMRDPAQRKLTAFKPEQFEPHIRQLVETLFDALDMPGSPENEHIMKAIMRLFSFSRSSLIIPLLPTVVPKITNKLGVVAKNPSKPYFNHYLFETLALTIRAACDQDNPVYRNDFENVLFNILQVILAQDVQEFTPYVLQLLNLILKSQPVGAVSEKFSELFQELLSPTWWEKPANTRPLTELMHTYIEKTGQIIITQNKLIPLLGVFQKLIASKATDHEGLALLQTMMIHLPASEFDARIRDIFYCVFTRLQESKTTKFVKNALVCFSLYAYLREADLLASSMNQLRAGIFGQVIEKFYISDSKKVTGSIERRICVCGMIKILCSLPLIDNGAYNNLWSPLLRTLMEILELPPEVVNEDDDHFVDVAESLDFQAQYSKLNYATVRRTDPTEGLTNLKAHLASSLAYSSSKLPGFIPNSLANMDPAVSACLMNYCREANVTIS